MKNLMSLLLITLGISAFSYAQEINQVRFDKEGSALAQALQKGEVSFFFNKGMDAQTVKENAQYYPNYFTVKYDSASAKCTLKLTQDDQAKLVISRFLMSCGINEVIVGVKVISVQDFMAEYLKN
jgi:hypothetical protein